MLDFYLGGRTKQVARNRKTDTWKLEIGRLRVKITNTCSGQDRYQEFVRSLKDCEGGENRLGVSVVGERGDLLGLGGSHPLSSKRLVAVLRSALASA